MRPQVRTTAKSCRRWRDRGSCCVALLAAKSAQHVTTASAFTCQERVLCCSRRRSGHLHCQHNDDLITSGQSWPPKQAPSCECLMTCRDNFRSPLLHHTGREWSAQHVRLILGSGSSAQCDRPISSRHAPAATCQLRAAFSAIEYKSVTIWLPLRLLRLQPHLFATAGLPGPRT